MFQLIYISTAVKGVSGAPILATSRANNVRNGITGLLYADGHRFLQVLEGHRLPVEQTYARITADPRHRAPVVLSRREVGAREFGTWAMAERRPDSDGDAFLNTVNGLIAGASPAVRATFDSFVRLRRAA